MYGIPNMKLDKSVILRRRRLMEQEGIVFRTGIHVGKDLDPAALVRDYDAVILCCGARKPRALQAEGMEGTGGIFFAVDFLTAATKNLLGTAPLPEEYDAGGRHVVIVGGGDTGNDCIGTVIRMGCASVTALEMMPEPPKERRPDNPWPEWPKTLRTDYGHEEALSLFGSDPRIFRTTVKRVMTDGGRICAVETAEVSFEGGKLTLLEGNRKDPSLRPSSGGRGLYGSGKAPARCHGTCHDGQGRGLHGGRKICFRYPKGVYCRRHAPGTEPGGLGPGGRQGVRGRGGRISDGLSEQLKRRTS